MTLMEPDGQDIRPEPEPLKERRKRLVRLLFRESNLLVTPLHARPSFYLVLLFGLIFGLNIIPAFAPPTWMAVPTDGHRLPQILGSGLLLLIAMLGALIDSMRPF
jgi:hypothetical protein